MSSDIGEVILLQHGQVSVLVHRRRFNIHFPPDSQDVLRGSGSLLSSRWVSVVYRASGVNFLHNIDDTDSVPNCWGLFSLVMSLESPLGHHNTSTTFDVPV